MGSHAAALRSQGASQELVDAVGTDNLDGVEIDPKDRELLKYVKLLTLSPADVTDADVQAMREVGWTDEQIWEASLEVSIFSLLNRMSDAYGLDYPSGGWMPPKLREKQEKGKRKDSGATR